MSDATLARMEHGKYVGVRGEPRRDGVCVIRKPTLYALGSEVVRVARQDRVAHISKQSSEPFRSYWKCRSQIESVLVLSISFG
jgi:hypothetical protein